MPELNADGNLIGFRFVPGVNKYDFWVNEEVIYLHQFDFDSLIEMLLEYSDKDKMSFYSTIFNKMKSEEINTLLTNNDNIYNFMEDLAESKAEVMVDDYLPEDYFSCSDYQEQRKSLCDYMRNNYTTSEIFDSDNMTGEDIRDLIDHSKLWIEDIFSEDELNDWAYKNGFTYGEN